MTDQLTDALRTLESGGSRTSKRIPRATEGTVRLDVTDAAGTVIRQWFVVMENGTVLVREADPDRPQQRLVPDAVLRTDDEMFERLARGEERFVPLFFRNALVVEGQLGLVDLLTRVLFAGPSAAHHPRDFVHRQAEAS
ncbi:SCP2 sterol-binding domain-containing protein [Solwaraspora sp. WMMD406]|uniref:SCP2 sterol-binding domain-containing protein n=1 Tax=Solwaraspora sp. WMMD406 TaxID=3016095 RepID=UPI00241707B4|nr:SCP2 sterol-binding domain-containing protein [Solwaraspora sp. WMMD406]MDG4764380.1 SCP2 sterol-binding domain-containing protein [Solwaraspora sp. WMMD406]